MAHIDYTPITDPGLQLLEAVASCDIPWCTQILEDYERDHRALHHANPQTIETATTVATSAHLPYPAVVDLINNTRDEDGYTPLILAFQSTSSQHGALPMIHHLLAKGGNIDTVPQRVRARIQWEKEQKPTCDSYHHNNGKPSFLASAWDDNGGAAHEGQTSRTTRVETTVLPTMGSRNIEKEKYKEELIEQNDLFYQRRVKRGSGKDGGGGGSGTTMYS
jgi:hypothetical protein